MSKEIILKVENLSKQYRLGVVDKYTLRDDLKRWWYRIRGKEDPFVKVGEVNDRSQQINSEYVWALKKINFEVQKGEVLGIIGANGAGKSTLLKILSKITTPTTGSVKYKGRIASLLEVGTGFHGELTGRENVYLNGAILGMTKDEITSKMDAIVEFSGCEGYIDTPVKRYSSGMGVRLGFAVAAFLEPDILIVDEVLAVGDAEFQKMAINKMQEISRGENGRTILFVSHNMVSIQNLCTRVILLDKGGLVKEGDVNEMINLYKGSLDMDQIERINNGSLNLTLLNNIDNINIESDIVLKFRLDIKEKIENEFFADIAIKNDINEHVIQFKMDYTNFSLCHEGTGIKFFSLKIQKPNLLPGDYFVDAFLYDKNDVFLWIQNLDSFCVGSKNSFTKMIIFNGLRVKTLPKFSFEAI
jgi:lipopolysaccharide transport system ATP-binding protein